ncbi:MAG: YidC/Oxa1 family membrane protein insertase, partial [Treponema sp.]|nr:YidC/Oxa1 family membrane protein insertase [Treponema sp.]
AVAEHWQQVERDVQKKMKAGLEHIKKAFNGDERYMMTQAFYRENHYSPIMALRSSFGLLIQIPFFMAAYQFLSGLEAIKGVPFLFIRDMGAPDATFHIGGFPVNVLPIAMTLINMAAGIVYTKGLAARDKIQVHGMAVIFLAILYNSPSGLVLYWTMNNVFSLVKNVFYKLKNPLKTFWLCSCALCAAAAVYIIFLFEAKAAYKMAFCALLALVFAAPLFVKAAKKLLDTRLLPLVEQKAARNLIFVLSCVLLAILFGLMVPTSLISSSASEFAGIGKHPNPFWYIGNTALQAAAIFLFWFPCVYLLFSKKVQALMATGAAILCFAALVNAHLFMLAYGDISASLGFLAAADFRSMSTISFLNLAVLALVVAASIVLAGIKNALTSVLAISIFTCVFTIGLNSKAIQNEYKSYMATAQNQKKGANISPIFRLSKNHPNVILIMLDRAQGQFFEENLAEAPELAKQFSGFVFYNNTLSFNGHTFFGAPPLFGGYEYTPTQMQKRGKEGVPTKDQINQSQLAIPRIFNEPLGYWASVNDPDWINSNTYCDLSFLKGYDIEGNETIGAYTQQWYKAHPESSGLD